MEPYGIGAGSRSDGATTAACTPRWTSFVWYSLVLDLLKTVGRIDHVRLTDAIHMEKPISNVVPPFTNKSVAKIEVHVILAEMGVLWHILLCELVSREEKVDDALNGEDCRCSHVYVRAAVALAAFAELHSLGGTEATAAKAQQKATNNRCATSHRDSYAIPCVTVRVGMPGSLHHIKVTLSVQQQSTQQLTALQ